MSGNYTNIIMSTEERYQIAKLQKAVCSNVYLTETRSWFFMISRATNLFQGIFFISAVLSYVSQFTSSYFTIALFFRNECECNCSVT